MSVLWMLVCLTYPKTLQNRRDILFETLSFTIHSLVILSGPTYARAFGNHLEHRLVILSYLYYRTGLI